MREYSKVEQKLAFGQVLQAVEENCLSAAGRRLVERIEFSSDYPTVEKQLGLTDEFLSILLSNKAFPSQDYFDMAEQLKPLMMQGSFISAQSLFQLWRSLETIVACLDFFARDEKNEYPLLKSMCANVEVEEEILRRCSRLLDSEGEILDTASEELFSIRTNIRRSKSEVEKRLRKLLNISKSEGWTPADAELTVRDGKGVIPIASSDKRRLQGFVLDESASGRTAYVEPAEVVELNNRVRELEFEQAREIVRILTEFTDFLRPMIPLLLSAYDFLARIDFIRAKARYAYKIGGGKPVLTRRKGLFWFEARHPLLEQSLKKQGKTIVPLQIELNEKRRIMIISGPNAGGKSVCLKTVGLLQYMLQCGLLVPMKQSGECSLFRRIFIDIGDEQSLENDLSTYSSHLLNMKHLCEAADEDCLFLIDECGTGTDPNVGGAIAEAVLEDLNAKGAYGIVTTHYSNLKLLSERYPAVTNAAMLFDTKAMKPLYKLSVGNPGSSFAFEIARTIGLPQSIIDAASKKTGSGFMDFEQSLQSLSVEKMEIKSKQSELALADELLDSLVRQYQNKTEEIAHREKEILFEAKKQAKQILRDANREIERTIREIRTAKAEKQRTQKLREELKASVERTEKEIGDLEKAIEESQTAFEQTETPKEFSKTANEKSKTHIPFDPTPIVEGDIVLLTSQNSYATVLKVRKNKADVACGSVSLSLPISQLRKVKKESYLASRKQASQTNKTSSAYGIMEDINRLRGEFSYQIDLRGERADDALRKLAKQIDNARLLGEGEISVLHGKGDGILKTVLRDYLKDNPEVESFKAARVEFGGEGITQIKLK